MLGDGDFLMSCFSLVFQSLVWSVMVRNAPFLAMEVSTFFFFFFGRRGVSEVSNCVVAFGGWTV